MIDQLLRDIGLSTKEAEMYIILLRNGTQSTSLLARQLKMNRGTAYTILHQLLDKGLAKKSTKKGVQYFSPLDPKNIVSYLEAQKRKIDANQEKVEAMMGQLMAITNPLTAKPKIEFFDGPEGARTVIESILHSDEKTIHAFLSLADVIDFIGAGIYEELEQKRIKAGYSLHAIRTREKDKDALELDPRAKHHTTSTEDKRQVRYAPADLAFPMTMFLFDDKVAILSSRRENFALVVQSNELSQMLKKLFDLLWLSLDQSKIKVGILHSLSRPMAPIERSLVDAELMAIDEINESGGVLGKQLEPIVVDGASDPKTFARETERLIAEEGVCSIFGGYISITRKAMLPVVEKYNHLLWYPTQYEGLEQSKSVIYVGSAITPKIVTGIDWAYEHLGQTFFFIGSDDIFSRTAYEILRYRIEELGGKVVDQHFEPLRRGKFTKAVEAIVRKKPDVIVSIINDETNSAFFKELRSAGIKSKDIPTIFFSTTEEEIKTIGVKHLLGDYAVMNYVENNPSKNNIAFVRAFQEKYGKHRKIGDGLFSAYIAVHLFAKALKKAGTEDVHEIAKAARGIAVDTPDGTVEVDRENQHAHRKVRIVKICEEGALDVLWESKTTIRSHPYPKYKSHEEWDKFLIKLQKDWKGNWSA